MELHELSLGRKVQTRLVQKVKKSILPEEEESPKNGLLERVRAWSLSERMVSSLMSLEATIVSVLNHATSNFCAIDTKVSRATCKYEVQVNKNLLAF